MRCGLSRLKKRAVMRVLLFFRSHHDCLLVVTEHLAGLACCSNVGLAGVDSDRHQRLCALGKFFLPVDGLTKG